MYQRKTITNSTIFSQKLSFSICIHKFFIVTPVTKQYSRKILRTIPRYTSKCIELDPCYNMCYAYEVM